VHTLLGSPSTTAVPVLILVDLLGQRFLDVLLQGLTDERGTRLGALVQVIVYADVESTHDVGH
jgi:hypothetical protein